MSEWFAFTVAALAVFRVTELVTFDKVFAWARKAVAGVPVASALLTCYHCCSMHLSLYAALYAHYLGYTDWPHFFGYWLGLAGASVVIYRSVRPRDS